MTGLAFYDPPPTIKTPADKLRLAVQCAQAEEICRLRLANEFLRSQIDSEPKSMAAAA